MNLHNGASDWERLSWCIDNLSVRAFRITVENKWEFIKHYQKTELFVYRWHNVLSLICINIKTSFQTFCWCLHWTARKVLIIIVLSCVSVILQWVVSMFRISFHPCRWLSTVCRWIWWETPSKASMSPTVVNADCVLAPRVVMAQHVRTYPDPATSTRMLSLTVCFKSSVYDLFGF